MTSIAYINGRYQHIATPAVFIEDRGYQFADAVYEVCAIEQGKLRDVSAHLSRLAVSLAALEIPPPMDFTRALPMVMRELVRRNKISNGAIYLQVSRGVAARAHLPPDYLEPTLVMSCKKTDPQRRAAIHRHGLAAISVEDIRWGRCDIKSVSLLGNVLAAQAAERAGVSEAWQVRDGRVTEGAAANAWMIKGKVLHTAPLGKNILGGITRKKTIAAAKKLGLSVREKSFTIAAAKSADECFSTASTMGVMPIVELDGKLIGDGKVGEVTKKLIKRVD